VVDCGPGCRAAQPDAGLARQKPLERAAYISGAGRILGLWLGIWRARQARRPCRPRIGGHRGGRGVDFYKERNTWPTWAKSSSSFTFKAHQPEDDTPETW
jgi:hypothetical protein